MPASAPTRKDVKPNPGKVGKPTSRKKDVHEQEVTVWDPQGKAHRVLRHQANDLTRHCGWKSAPAKGMEVVDATVRPEKEADAADTPEGAEPAPAAEPDELDLLRAALNEKGVEVDNRWGKKRLKEELEKLAE